MHMLHRYLQLMLSSEHRPAVAISRPSLLFVGESEYPVKNDFIDKALALFRCKCYVRMSNCIRMHVY